MGIVSVEEVTRGASLTRFTELPHALHGSSPCWAPPVLAWERYRLDSRRNPYFDTGDACYLLARRRGVPAGRIVAHLPAPGAEGRFGFWCTGDDLDVATALVSAAQAWLAGQGCASMAGPWSFTLDDEPGVLVAGHDKAGTTGRPWHPRWEADLLEALGGAPLAEHATWRLPTTEVGPVLPLDDDLPGQAGGYADRRLVLEGIAAVPDLSGALRGSRLRAAWGLARRARLGEWETCTVVRCTADPVVAVPALRAAAGRAGYRAVVAPWSPDPGVSPETRHRTYRFTW